MNHDLKPYLKYKTTGSLWLNRVPFDWDFLRTKTVLKERSEKGYPDEPLLAATQAKGVVRKENFESRTVLAQKDLHNLKLVQVDDFVISLRSFQGGIEYAREKGIISPAYTILFPYDPQNQRYLSWLFKSKDYIDNLKLHVTGIREGQNIDYVKLGRSRIPLPPLPEQKAIVHYLDYMDRRVQKYIAAKEKQIRLLEEYEQAVIHQAVTRGLNPDVPMKPSGVEWLGDIPAHWEIRPLKRWVTTKVTDGPHETPDFIDNGVPFLSAEAMVNGGLDFNLRRGNISTKAHEEYCRKCKPQRDDIFMCKSGATTGKVSIVRTDDEFSVWSPLALIRVNANHVNPNLLFLVLQTSYVQKQIQMTWSYGTQQNLSMGAMERLAILLPPKKEQRVILDFLLSITEPVNKLISCQKNEIELMKELSKRLRDDVVTGKLDIRNNKSWIVGEIE